MPKFLISPNCAIWLRCRLTACRFVVAQRYSFVDFICRQTAFVIKVKIEMPSSEYITINIQIFMFIDVLT